MVSDELYHWTNSTHKERDFLKDELEKACLHSDDDDEVEPQEIEDFLQSILPEDEVLPPPVAKSPQVVIDPPPVTPSPARSRASLSFACQPVRGPGC